MRVLVLAVVVAMSLAGCKSREELRNTLNSWVGHPADELALKWGPPERSYRLDSGGRIVTYVQRSDVTLPGQTKTDTKAVGDYLVTTTTREPDSVHHFYCTINFHVDRNGIISGWSFEGNNCYA